MPISYIDGDLFETHCYYIAHGCNAQGAMNSGIAKTIRNRYPRAFFAYMQEHVDNGLKVGDAHFVKCDSKTIINAITQEFYGRDPSRIYVSYEGLRSAFTKINETISGEQLAIPLIGAGLARGDWSIIEEIVKETLTNVDCLVYRYKD